MMDSNLLNMDELELIGEGKTKKIYAMKKDNDKGFDEVLVSSKDRITAGDGEKNDALEGKAVISTETTSSIFEFLKDVAEIPTHFIRRVNPTTFLAKKCDMIPIEWVSRRLATGSFLKRNPGVPEGYRFSPPKLEIFFKDDENHDPQWSLEQLKSANLKCGENVVKPYHVDQMAQLTVGIFEILERAWASCDVTLVDMKIEFGFVVGENDTVVLADVIDSDSWRIWPMGDKRQMKDKQVYRDLKEVTPEALAKVKLNFQWVADALPRFLRVDRPGRVVVVMGSKSDEEFCSDIAKHLKQFNVKYELRIVSAHKAPEDTIKLVRRYEDGVPTVIIAVAGRSNGLGPVIAGNTALPVINCPPVAGNFATSDVWSSMRLPSGLGCSTVLGGEGAALAAAKILSLHDHLVWAKLRGRRLMTWVALADADRKLTEDAAAETAEEKMNIN